MRNWSPCLSVSKSNACIIASRFSEFPDIDAVSSSDAVITAATIHVGKR
jgi:hypothetical protein